MFTTSYLPTIGGLQLETAWQLDALDGMIDKKFEFYFLAPNKAALKYCNFENIRVINLNLKPYTKIGLIKNVITLWETVRFIKPDIVHGQSIVPDGLIIYLCRILFNQKYKYILTSHGRDLVKIPDIKYGNRLKWYIDYLTKLVLKKCSKIVVPSLKLFDIAHEIGIEKDKLLHIPNGVKVYNPQNNDCTATIIKRWSISKNDMCLLSLSSLTLIKDLDSLIEGTRLATAKTNNIKLFIVGDGEMKEYLKNKVERYQLNRYIKFIGNINEYEKDAYLEISDVFCITSIFENFPVSILEAMSYGKSLIATNVGGIPDIVKHNNNGILIRPKNPYDIAKAILKIYHDKEFKEKISKNAIMTSKKYDIKDITEKYYNLYLKETIFTKKTRFNINT
tara:strand:- start:491 stop:1666 length:1176 start_codon:yes stop_codon:yes gene_type:complete